MTKDFDWVKSVHSALIDVIRQQFGETTLELGLPKRFTRLSEIGASKHLLCHPTDCPVLALSGNSTQDEATLKLLLTESLKIVGVKAGEFTLFTTTEGETGEPMPLSTGVLFPIRATERNESYHFGVIVRS